MQRGAREAAERLSGSASTCCELFPDTLSSYSHAVAPKSRHVIQHAFKSGSQLKISASAFRALRKARTLSTICGAPLKRPFEWRGTWRTA